MTPVLEFFEQKTAYGTRLRGEISLNSMLTIPHQGGTKARVECEDYIISQIQDAWLRMRGYPKLIDAKHKLVECLPHEQSLEVINILDDLINELNEPQFIIKGRSDV